MKKTKKKRKYNPNKHKKPAPPPAINPLKQSMELLNCMKPVIEAAQRVQERQRERAKESETK